MIKVVYIATDLIKTDEGYCFNAVYAFKTMTSVSGYEKYQTNCKKVGCFSEVQFSQRL